MRQVWNRAAARCRWIVSVMMSRDRSSVVPARSWPPGGRPGRRNAGGERLNLGVLTRSRRSTHESPVRAALKYTGVHQGREHRATRWPVKAPEPLRLRGCEAQAWLLLVIARDPLQEFW